MRDLSLPNVEASFSEPNTEIKSTTEGDLLFLEQLLQHRDLRHLSPAQKNRRGELIAALVDFYRTVSYTATYFSSAKQSDTSKPYALIGFLVIRTASSHQSAEILQAGFEAPEQNEALRHWAFECGLNNQEIALLLHPESISEPGSLETGFNHNFEGLRIASLARQDGGEKQLFAVSDAEFEGGALATKALDSRPEFNDSPSQFWGLREIPVGESPGQPFLRAVMVPSYNGEPLIALTFSRSF